SKGSVIEELSIWDSNGLNMVYKIYLSDKSKGRAEIFLFKENPGYQTVDQQLQIPDSNKFHFLPNTKYNVQSTNSDFHVEIILHTDKNAEVDDVINKFSCK
ncbi:MAG TPA: hypothetical protein VFE71_01960, partial [Bacteroidales bacterium]|nr:hypothetical protein [Bacteroidales bacterium]